MNELFHEYSNPVRVKCEGGSNNLTGFTILQDLQFYRIYNLTGFTILQDLQSYRISVALNYIAIGNYLLYICKLLLLH